MNNAKPLLTIAIPTYNRASYLDMNLQALSRQMDDLRPGELEVLVSNNASPDNTREVVSRYKNARLPLRYMENDTNIGPDNNFIQCFQQARGRYVLIMGDDDLLMPGALRRLLNFLKDTAYGVVYLGSFGYEQDFQAEIPTRKNAADQVYTDPARFLRNISYYVAYASGNVVNKDILTAIPGFDPARFDGTHFPQVYWYIQAALRAQQNARIGAFLVAGKRNNAGNYRFCQIFGVNLNRVFDWFVRNTDMPPKVFRAINRHLLLTLFPYFILRYRGMLNNESELENYYAAMKPVYYSYPCFWIFNVPLMLLPRPLCRWLYRIGDRLYRASRGQTIGRA